MPAKSTAQMAAMEEAAHGKSNLGIPKSVGKEFVNATHGHTLVKGHVHGAKVKGGIKHHEAHGHAPYLEGK